MLTRSHLSNFSMILHFAYDGILNFTIFSFFMILRLYHFTVWIDTETDPGWYYPDLYPDPDWYWSWSGLILIMNKFRQILFKFTPASFKLKIVFRVFYILFHLIYIRMPLHHYPETGHSSPPSSYKYGVSLISKAIDRKSLQRFHQGSNSWPPSPKGNRC